MARPKRARSSIGGVRAAGAMFVLGTGLSGCGDSGSTADGGTSDDGTTGASTSAATTTTTGPNTTGTDAGSTGPSDCVAATDCDDGLFCNGEEVCDVGSGACGPGTPPALDDGIACTDDTCDEMLAEVVHTPIDAMCDDAMACNGVEVCDAAMDCVAGEPLPGSDEDLDGFTNADGDCNDCDPLVNPAALDLPGNTVDDDCDQAVDEVEPACDGGIALDTNDPLDAVRAMGLCKIATSSNDSGIVSAAWVLPDGGSPPPSNAFDLGHGVLAAFGPNVAPREGTQLLVLSSGTARTPSDPGFQSLGGFSKGYTSGHPFGFPKESPSCPGVVTGNAHDGIALEVVVRAPPNVSGFALDFDFYSYEWPTGVCTPFNDTFAPILEPFPMGQADGNIGRDGLGNPITVNNVSFQVCGCPGGAPCLAGGLVYDCPLGNAELAGTGFGSDTEAADHGATSWLTMMEPVLPGDTFTLRLGVYSAGDGVVDSSVLLDNFAWVP